MSGAKEWFEDNGWKVPKVGEIPAWQILIGARVDMDRPGKYKFLACYYDLGCGVFRTSHGMQMDGPPDYYKTVHSFVPKEYGGE